MIKIPLWAKSGDFTCDSILTHFMTGIYEYANLAPASMVLIALVYSFLSGSHICRNILSGMCLVRGQRKCSVEFGAYHTRWFPATN